MPAPFLLTRANRELGCASDGSVVLGARETIRAGRLPIFVMEVSPRLAQNGIAHYMRAFEFATLHGYRCYDCATSGHAVMPWMKGVPFPNEKSYRAISRLHDLYNHSVIVLGGNQGGWTNVICTTEKRMW